MKNIFNISNKTRVSKYLQKSLEVQGSKVYTVEVEMSYLKKRFSH